MSTLQRCCFGHIYGAKILLGEKAFLELQITHIKFCCNNSIPPQRAFKIILRLQVSKPSKQKLNNSGEDMDPTPIQMVEDLPACDIATFFASFCLASLPDTLSLPLCGFILVLCFLGLSIVCDEVGGNIYIMEGWVGTEGKGGCCAKKKCLLATNPNT
jgi:hypothetical protein